MRTKLNLGMLAKRLLEPLPAFLSLQTTNNIRLTGAPDFLENANYLGIYRNSDNSCGNLAVENANTISISFDCLRNCLLFTDNLVACFFSNGQSDLLDYKMVEDMRILQTEDKLSASIIEVKRRSGIVYVPVVGRNGKFKDVYPVLDFLRKCAWSHSSPT